MVKNTLLVEKTRQALCALFGFIHYLNAGLLTSHAAILIRQLRLNGMFISEDDASWITSVGVLPMAPASIISGLLMQIVPKRYILMLAYVLEIIGWAESYFLSSNSLGAILIGRFIIGIALGLSGPVIALYLAEVTDPKLRGLYTSIVVAGLPIGIMAFNIAGAVLSWEPALLICMSFSVLNLLVIIYLQESYVWYLKKYNADKVREAFFWYRGNNEKSQLEVSKYISHHLDKKLTNTHEFNVCIDFKENAKLLGLPLFASLTLMLTSHLSGTKVIAFYSMNMMGKVIPTLSIYISTVILDSIRVIATIISCILIKTCRRRILIIISGCGSALSHFFFCGFHSYTSTDEQVFSMLSLLSVVMYILFSSIGIAALPWVICGEIFPLKVKNIGSAIASFVFYISFFLVIKYSYLLEIYLGLIGEFILFGCCTLLGTVILYFFLPETKNQTLGEIEDNIVTKVA